MLVLPAVTDVTTPVPAFTVATAVLLLLQAPPASPVELYCAVVEVHIGDVPLTVPALASGLTVKLLPADIGPPALQPPVIV